jgi:L-histidine N-alpha-methyltransferase
MARSTSAARAYRAEDEGTICAPVRWVRADPAAERAAFARDVVEGLAARPKRLPCRYFYDAEGSRLFEAICELPEYYLTRAEREILTERADEIAALFPRAVSMVELGSGSSAKTRLLIEAFLRRHAGLQYLPIDISPTILAKSARALRREYPRLEITAIAAEYAEGLRRLAEGHARPRLILWLGSNVGNFERDAAAAFLAQVRAAMAQGDRLLMGVDLRKERAALEAAYNDAQGVTARFNLNLLTRINGELGGTFDLAGFRHVARYNPRAGRVEMHLESLRSQLVTIAGIGLTVPFASGETIHTENSYKYSVAEIEDLARGAGLRVTQRWLDTAARFSVNLLTRD